MATKVVSSRIEESKLATLEALTQQAYGMSFGKYCSSVLADAICEAQALPEIKRPAANKRVAAVENMKAFARQPHNEQVGALSDEELKNLIAGRYA